MGLVITATGPVVGEAVQARPAGNRVRSPRPKTQSPLLEMLVHPSYPAHAHQKPRHFLPKAQRGNRVQDRPWLERSRVQVGKEGRMPRCL